MTPLEVHEAVRRFYLALPGRTEDRWQRVAQDPAKFNWVWRKMAGQAVGSTPPDIKVG